MLMSIAIMTSMTLSDLLPGCGATTKPQFFFVVLNVLAGMGTPFPLNLSFSNPFPISSPTGELPFPLPISPLSQGVPPPFFPLPLLIIKKFRNRPPNCFPYESSLLSLPISPIPLLVSHFPFFYVPIPFAGTCSSLLLQLRPFALSSISSAVYQFPHARQMSTCLGRAHQR